MRDLPIRVANALSKHFGVPVDSLSPDTISTLSELHAQCIPGIGAKGYAALVFCMQKRGFWANRTKNQGRREAIAHAIEDMARSPSQAVKIRESIRRLQSYGFVVVPPENMVPMWSCTPDQRRHVELAIASVMQDGELVSDDPFRV